jgi:hypothetical protein
MRRAASYSPNTEESHGEQGFWPSYADMMSAVALILFFLMLLSYVQNLITGNNLRNTEDLLATTKAQVQEALEEYRKAQAEMRQAVAVKANIDHLLGHTDGRENKAQER